MTKISLIKRRCKECYITIFPKKHLKSIIGVKAYITGQNNTFLLVQRSNTDIYNPLEWEFPGGSIKKGENPLESLKREVYEETKIIIECIPKNCYVFSDDIKVGIKSIYAGFRRYIFFYTCSSNKDTKVYLSYEHSNYIWCNKEKALTLRLTKDTKDFLQNGI